MVGTNWRTKRSEPLQHRGIQSNAFPNGGAIDPALVSGRSKRKAKPVAIKPAKSKSYKPRHKSLRNAKPLGNWRMDGPKVGEK